MYQVFAGLARRRTTLCPLSPNTQWKSILMSQRGWWRRSPCGKLGL